MFSTPRTFVVLALTLIGAAPAAASAQDLVSGERVRLSLTSDQRVTGTIVSSDATSIVVRSEDGGASTTVQRAAIVRADRHAGTRRNWGYGLLVGAASGLTTAAILEATNEPDENEWEMPGLVYTGYTLLGALTGTVVGALIETDRWERVSAGPAVGIEIGDSPGIAVSWVVRF